MPKRTAKRNEGSRIVLKNLNPKIISAADVKVGDVILSGKFRDEVSSVADLGNSVVIRCNEETASLIRRKTEKLILA